MPKALYNYHVEMRLDDNKNKNNNNNNNKQLESSFIFILFHGYNISITTAATKSSITKYDDPFEIIRTPAHRMEINDALLLYDKRFCNKILSSIINAMKP